MRWPIWDCIWKCVVTFRIFGALFWEWNLRLTWMFSRDLPIGVWRWRVAVACGAVLALADTNAPWHVFQQVYPAFRNSTKSSIPITYLLFQQHLRFPIDSSIQTTRASPKAYCLSNFLIDPSYYGATPCQPQSQYTKLTLNLSMAFRVLLAMLCRLDANLPDL